MAHKDPDYAEKLEALRLARKTENEAKKKAAELKGELLEPIKELGQFYFIDSDGNKRRAYYGDADMTVVDIDEFERCVADDLVSQEVFDEVVTRKADLEALETAINAGRVPKVVVQRAVRVEKGRATVKFSDPERG